MDMVQVVHCVSPSVGYPAIDLVPWADGVPARIPDVVVPHDVVDVELFMVVDHPLCGLVRALFEIWAGKRRSEEHTSELQSRENLVCRLLLEKKKSYTSII